MNYENYGKELILDLHDCNSNLFNRNDIRKYFNKVCDLIQMEKCKLCWWDDLYTPEEEKETDIHLVGTSAIQFIKTSNITIHALDILKRLYLNLFSCKNYDENIVMKYTEEWFEGKIVNKKVIQRI